MASFVAIDWQAPWLAPWRDKGQAVARGVEQGLALHEALNRQAGAPVRFVAHQVLPPRTAYEQFISETGQCPSRDNLHDFFNGLCWLHLPRSKARLNALQAAALASAPAGAPRGPLRDAITIFDENGALLDAPPALWEALRARDWQRLFVGLRPLWSEARALVFGHSLLEKLVRPHKAFTAHVWCTPCPLHEWPAADEWLAAQFQAECLSTKPFVPLPLLGIPGWWAGNENFSFYDDSLVFRAGRRGAPDQSRDRGRA